jgi:hypothetical protein
VLVEMTRTEQRCRAVLEVHAEVPVTEVAERFVAEVQCTTTKSIARFKVRKPESPRQKI